jgi:predicted DNA binding protein
MTQARLTVTLPEGIWIGDVSTSLPSATFTVLTAVPDETAAFALMRINEPNLDDLLSTIADHEQVVELSVIQQTNAEATVQVETTSPPLLQLAAQGSGMPIEFPVTISDGEATVDATGPHDRISELATQLSNYGLAYTIEYIQERLHTSQLLTEKQRHLVRTAVELGYYDTPRDCTLTELANEVGLAKSTCSETLHRAEEAMVKHFIEDLPTPIEAETRITAPESAP